MREVNDILEKDLEELNGGNSDVNLFRVIGGMDGNCLTLNRLVKLR